MPFTPIAARGSAPSHASRLMGASLALLALAVAAFPRPAAAREAQSDCPQRGKQAFSERAAWNWQHYMRAAYSPAELGGAGLRPGRTVRAFLRPARTIGFLARPGKPPRPGEFGGMFQIRIEQPGAYSIMLGSEAWLDVLKEGSALAPIGYGPGPACSTVRKTVEFQLDRGEYVIQVSANPRSTAVILVAHRPETRTGQRGVAAAPRGRDSADPFAFHLSSKRPRPEAGL